MNLKKILKVAIILIILMAGSLLLTYTLTGFSIKNHYTYTKAICDENNSCQDYIITCENKEVISMRKITGAHAQYSEDWTDNRENSEILCE